jgi:hypothetical protein
LADVGAKRSGERLRPLRLSQRLTGRRVPRCVTECQKPKALNRFFAGFIEQLMGNTIIKVPMARRFPKIVGFQTAICDRLNIFECIAKRCGHTI